MHELQQKYAHLFDPRGAAEVIASRRNPHFVKTLEEFAAVPAERRHLVVLTQEIKESVPIAEEALAASEREPLVRLDALIKARNSKIVLSVGAAYGAQSLETQALRVSVAERLLHAESLVAEMAPHLTLKITDSYRPIHLQRRYFDEIFANFKAQGLEGEELYLRTTDMIADPDRCPPHSTGATVDLTLFDWQKGEEMNLGTFVDDVENPAAALFYPEIPDEMRALRLLLFTAMREAGFMFVASEWWHYSCGDQEWAVQTEAEHALYGSVLE